MTNIYEADSFAHMPDGSMHPGGLRLTDRAVRLAGLQEGMRVADIGCGTGVTAAFLAGKYKLNVVGLEISGALIDVGLKNNLGLNLIRWDCGILPFEDNSLDAILFECTLSVLGNTQGILAQCAKALKRSGAVIVSDVYAKTTATNGKNTPLTAGMLEGLLSNAGFDININEDHTAALRTFAAEVVESSGATRDLGPFFGASCDLAGIRLSDLGYQLIIAKKNIGG